ncbi:hypothetical protein [Paraglaciecola sp. L3A3]|uniref:hypothetical protein n=1 Tax=Paraglaciecola sp. L3A3 TaxID=2686358 RepID=UPI00131B4EC9|nr:hypothetical protein [Paraglaciecola sp. L3A3]
MASENWLQRLANNPNKSWSRFKLGLGIFCLGALLILLGAKYWFWLQVPGLILITIGLVPAIIGYLGILAHRMTAGFKKPPTSFDKDK